MRHFIITIKFIILFLGLIYKYSGLQLCQEGLTIVENRTADIIQETRKLQIRRKGSGSSAQNLAADLPQMQADHETQLKASRDVRWQMCIRRINEIILRMFVCHESNLLQMSSYAEQFSISRKLNLFYITSNSWRVSLKEIIWY